MKTWLFLAAVNGFLGVAAGAFGTHGLAKRGLVQASGLFDTATRYQVWHALALAVVAWLVTTQTLKDSLWPRLAGWAFLAGIVLFSGSLYAFALTGARPLVYVTPVGGLAFLIGWVLMAVAAWKLPGERP